MVVLGCIVQHLRAFRHLLLLAVEPVRILVEDNEIDEGADDPQDLFAVRARLTETVIRSYFLLTSGQ